MKTTILSLLATASLIGCGQPDLTSVSMPASVSEFSVSAPLVRNGESAMLTALFSGGFGEIDHGIGAVESGVPVSTGAMAGTTRYTLTVTAEDGSAVTKSVAITVSNPSLAKSIALAPTIASFSATSSMFTMGDSAKLTAVFAGGVGTIDHFIGPVESGAEIATAALGEETHYTLTVTNEDGVSVRQSLTLNAIAAPSIASLEADATVLTSNTGTFITPIFTGGIGTLTGHGEVKSGVRIMTGNLPADTTYTLAVTNAAGATVTQSILLAVQ